LDLYNKGESSCKGHQWESKCWKTTWRNKQGFRHPETEEFTHS
jgi:hypothetical protein